MKQRTTVAGGFCFVIFFWDSAAHRRPGVGSSTVVEAFLVSRNAPGDHSRSAAVTYDTTGLFRPNNSRGILVFAAVRRSTLSTSVSMQTVNPIEFVAPTFMDQFAWMGVASPLPSI